MEENSSPKLPSPFDKKYTPTELLGSGNRKKFLLFFYNSKKKTGSFGAVWKCSMIESPEVNIAMKIITRNLEEESEFLEELVQKEISIMKLLKNDRIVRMIEEHKTNESYYIFMEL